MEIRVRAADSDDLERIVLFNQALARESEGRELDRKTLTAGVEAVLADASLGTYLLAETGEGEVVGQLLVTTEWSDWRNAEIWWIQSVYVSKQRRREGIYRTLHREVRARARDAGAAGLRLYVDRDNRAALDTYERLEMRPSHYRMFEEMWK